METQANIIYYWTFRRRFPSWPTDDTVMSAQAYQFAPRIPTSMPNPSTHNPPRHPGHTLRCNAVYAKTASSSSLRLESDSSSESVALDSDDASNVSVEERFMPALYLGLARASLQTDSGNTFPKRPPIPSEAEEPSVTRVKHQPPLQASSSNSYKALKTRSKVIGTSSISDSNISKPSSSSFNSVLPQEGSRACRQEEPFISPAEEAYNSSPYSDTSVGLSHWDDILQDPYIRRTPRLDHLPTGWYILKHVHSENFAGMSKSESSISTMIAMTNDNSNYPACYQVGESLNINHTDI
jgi:hypothetical protein